MSDEFDVVLNVTKFLRQLEETEGFDMHRWDQHEFEQSIALRGASREVEMPEDTQVFKTVDLKTELFSGKAIPLYQMPGMKVLEVMMLPHEPVKMMKMVELLVSALETQKEVDMLGIVSMHELNEVLSQWVDKSQEAEDKK